jgi:hypothetical protein
MGTDLFNLFIATNESNGKKSPNQHIQLTRTSRQIILADSRQYLLPS